MALTDIVQVTLLVLGGLMVAGIALTQIGGDAGIIAGFLELTRRVPDHFDMILSTDNPHYKDLPGLAVLFGGMWMPTSRYWGFNQYIIQRALAAKSLKEAQKGMVFAAYPEIADAGDHRRARHRRRDPRARIWRDRTRPIRR